MMHFGWRGCDEHQCVCLGDFTVATDTNGIDYVDSAQREVQKKEQVLNGKKIVRSSQECMLLEGIDVQ